MGNPRRFTVQPATLPHGKYTPGIGDKELAALVGYTLTIWSQVEDRMIDLFQFLAGIEHPEDARIVFRSIAAQKSRIDIMGKALKRSPHNVHVPSDVDAALDEYQSISEVRNQYAHGLWWNSREAGKTYLEPKLDNSGLIFIQGREVGNEEVKGLFDRMMALAQKLQDPDLYRR